MRQFQGLVGRCEPAREDGTHAPHPDTRTSMSLTSSAGQLAHLRRLTAQPDTLSIARSELLAVDHAIRVTVYASAGTLGLTSCLSVILPIRIVSMLSVDPPTCMSRPPDVLVSAHGNEPSAANGLDHYQHSGPENRPDSPPPYRTRPSSLEHPRDITVSDGDSSDAGSVV
jgi:hypothetical protein